MTINEFWLRFHWSLFLRVQITIFHHWFRQWLGMNRQQAIIWTKGDLVQWRIYESPSLNELIGHAALGVNTGSIALLSHHHLVKSQQFTLKIVFHLWVRGLQMSYSDSTRMIGYYCSSASYGKQATCLFVIANSLRAKILSEIYTYLYFSFLDIETVYVIGILPLGKYWPAYFIQWILWLLMACWQKEPGHLQPCY